MSTMYNNDDIYQLINEDVALDVDKVKVATDKIDVQMSILVDTLKKMQVKLNILQEDNSMMKSKLDSIEQDILLT